MKTLLPILENASLEDDEDLHDRWANLLANAAGANSKFHSAFPDILRQLSPTEARFLDVIHERFRQAHLSEWANSPDSVNWFNLRQVWDEVGFGENLSGGNTLEGFGSVVDNLVRLNLLLHQVIRSKELSPEFPFPSTDHSSFTEFSLQFVTACKKPGAA